MSSVLKALWLSFGPLCEWGAVPGNLGGYVLHVYRNHMVTGPSSCHEELPVYRRMCQCLGLYILNMLVYHMDDLWVFCQ